MEGVDFSNHPVCGDVGDIEGQRGVLHPESAWTGGLKYKEHAVVCRHLLAKHQPTNLLVFSQSQFEGGQSLIDVDRKCRARLCRVHGGATAAGTDTQVENEEAEVENSLQLLRHG